MADRHPCMTCGACCAAFRVSFYWAEADDATPGGVPVQLTSRINDFRSAMLGTDCPHPRCVALEGVVGQETSCTIYERRSSTCREFTASWENGVHDERCDHARALCGLSPLTPESWPTGDIPRVA